MMSRLIITNGRVITPWQVLEKGTVVVEEGKIVAVREGSGPPDPKATVIDAAGKIVSPGYIDIHVHGAAGYDTMDATPQAIQGMARFFASHGVTGFLPTTITAPQGAILAAIENAALCQREGTGGARVLGVHLEGPYISPSQPGAQPPQYIRPADPQEYPQFFAWDNIKLITLAPEIPENSAFIPYAVSRGAAVAVGHSAASYEELVDAVASGLTQSSHTFNGMVGLHHRQPGTAGACLALDEIYAQVIVDNVHIHPAVVKILVRAKGTKRTLLITDAMRATGMSDGEYDLGGQKVIVSRGEARLPSGTLAGSTLTIDQAVRNVMMDAGLTFEEALPMATSVPAESIGLGDQVGSIAPGKAADIVLLTPDYRVVMTMVGGQVVYQASET
ncbi:MAG: N-acetylglucosamine-6-phosphate deacetylase [Chloroflexi bacterium]|nr:N-acetylglucosamine-6-phosphate deacetylase [Chloroflexota bacterium]